MKFLIFFTIVAFSMFLSIAHFKTHDYTQAVLLASFLSIVTFISHASLRYGNNGQIVVSDR